MLTDFGYILLFIIAALILLGLMLTIAKFLRPHKPNEEKLTTYESGEEPLGNANIQFNVRFYVVALIFVLFEVELLFLFPWAVVFGNEELIEQTNGQWGWFAMAEMTVFIGIPHLRPRLRLGKRLPRLGPAQTPNPGNQVSRSS